MQGSTGVKLFTFLPPGQASYFSMFPYVYIHLEKRDPHAMNLDQTYLAADKIKLFYGTKLETHIRA